MGPLKIIVNWIPFGWRILAGIPTLLAVIDLLIFPWTPNQGVFRSFFSPSYDCKNVATSDKFEGSSYRYLSTVQFYAPLSRFLPFVLVKPIEIGISAAADTAMTRLINQTFNASPLALRYSFGVDQQEIRSISLPYRFLKREQASIQVELTSKYQIGDNECPLQISSRLL